MIDKITKVYFWQPELVRATDQDFPAALTSIVQNQNVGEFLECSGGLRLRVERVQNEMDGLSGDFVRQQTDNIPPVAQNGQPLVPNFNPLGHRAAWLYVTNANVLALQSNRPGVSAGAINAFIRRCIPGHRGFMMGPCLSVDAENRLANGEVRSLEVAVARPSDLGSIDDDEASLEDNLANLGDFVGAPKLDIRFGFERGNRDGRLSIENVRKAVRWGLTNRENIKKLKVDLAGEDEPVDFLLDRAVEKRLLSLPENDLDEAFNVRKEFVRDALEQNLPALQAQYG